MKILVLNSGSSSLKYELFDMPKEKTLAKGLIEKIGLKGGVISHKSNGKKIETKKDFKSHKEAINEALILLTKGDNAIIGNIKEIDAVGHRVVHGGEKFSDSVIINEDILKEIKSCSDLAPLHNPSNIQGILACQEIMPNTPQIGVFDTAFHQSMEKENYLYAIPYEYYIKHGIRKYGFHGTSHKYVSKRACQFLNEDFNTKKIITCHIGNGASIAAIKDGKVVNTSMGFTPLAGLVMGTRSGDIDPAIVDYLSQKEKLSTQEINNILNKKSGLLGISGQSSDMRDIETGDSNCQLALDIYINRIIEYIGSYIALIGGLDILVFTAGVGEKSPIVRQKIIDRLGYLGINLDEKQNDKKSEETIISKKDSKIRALIIPTQEELMMAKDTYTLVHAIM
ncbi:MAG TPA: acetate kinase [Candidatus Absconditabacterales bacterium]|nr:acetate kinase [Candidatus Absconditabacterales bacterium]